MNYVGRKETIGRVDKELLPQYNTQVNYWKNILRRIVAVATFLASRGLYFRGDHENLCSKNDGNYLGCLEVISEFDSFLPNHIQNHGYYGSTIIKNYCQRTKIIKILFH